MALRNLIPTVSPFFSPSLASLSSHLWSTTSPSLHPASHPKSFHTTPPTASPADPTPTPQTPPPPPPETNQSSSPPPPPGPPTIIVFGGRGFVGSSVCKAALSSGLHVISISPSGTPPLSKSPWVSQVQWLRGNGLEPQTFAHLLPKATAVISCIGAFGSQDYMAKINGTANVNVFEQSAAAGVSRAVFISANIPNVPGISIALKGYVEGKRQAEEALWANFPQGGVALRPSFIYGTRTVSGSLQLPLQWVGVPMKTALSHVPNRHQLQGLPLLGALFVPPVSVEAVGKAAVRAATDPAITARTLEVDDIAGFE